MSKLKGAVAHHEREIAELRADRDLAAEYVKAAIESLNISEERNGGLLGLRSVAEACGGLDRVAAEAGISRESLCLSLSVNGNPTLAILLAVLKSVEMRLFVAPGIHSVAPAQSSSRAIGAKIMVEKFTPYDPAPALDSSESIEAFLVDAFETEDAAHIAIALGDVARAEGIAALAEQTELPPEELRRSLNEVGNPTLSTTLAILRVSGLRLTTAATPVRPTDSPENTPSVAEGADIR